eukprot:CAMPEP_0172314910 /NCGR_PEP_ID=MMETSP1058-20130122/23496_1 /TAXON_ID=83371 /ORGANISM="Detonula confervacea, Strain CCMP 353" /LENGTH=458 /DNA_ID=CAMNT_0013028863 /DNA_START=78 /DNA_END=1451 /DNA_ORIENTATION=+
MSADETKEATETADTQRRERVKARWSMLRQALLGTSSASGSGGCDASDNSNGAADHSDGRFHKLSMNSFSGFQVLDRAVLPCDENDEQENGLLSTEGNWDIVQYSYTSTEGHKVKFITREAKEKQQTNQQSQKSTIQSRVEALMSHRNYGVDNTGNVRVWDAEGTLAGFLLSVVLDGDDVLGGDCLSDLRKNLRSILTDTSMKDTARGRKATCNLLELGAGQAGLAGLAMASASNNHNCSHDTERTTQMKPLHVVLTDGHPKCVENNETCAKMIPKSEVVSRVRIEAHLLLWDSSSKGADACCQITKVAANPQQVNNGATDKGLYQLCLASDCVHFQEFHDGLLTTIARTLAVGGIALLCQPKRGTSLLNFMTLIDAVNISQSDDFIGKSNPTIHCKDVTKCPALFQMTLHEDFYPKVSAMHKSLLLETNIANENASSNTTAAQNSTPQSSSRYDPNW